MPSLRPIPRAGARRWGRVLLTLWITLSVAIAAGYSKIRYGYFFYPPGPDSLLLNPRQIHAMMGVSLEWAKGHPTLRLHKLAAVDRSGGNTNPYYALYDRVLSRLPQNAFSATWMDAVPQVEGLPAMLQREGLIPTDTGATQLAYGYVLDLSDRNGSRHIAILLHDDGPGWIRPYREIIVSHSAEEWHLDSYVSYRVPVGLRDEELYFPEVLLALAVLLSPLGITGDVLLIVRWIRIRRDRRKECCANCSYDLAGLPGATCPECGFENAYRTHAPSSC